MGKAILIVNDDATFNRVYAAAFKEAGFKVDSLQDGKLGLTRILADKPDLILLGLMLPTMNGFDVLKVVKERETTKDIPVLMCSHLLAPGSYEESEARAMGAAAVFYKAACTPAMIIAAGCEALKPKSPA